MSRTHAPDGRLYLTSDPEEVHERIWSGFSGVTGWDIGANEGQSVQRMLQGFRKVVALEPAAESFMKLHADWGRDERVTLLNFAAGAECGMLETSVRWTPMGSGQLCSRETPEDGWHGRHAYARKVPCITLDSLTDEYGFPDFVKVDTEGFEVQVLRGAAKLIEHGCDWLIEWHSEELLSECFLLLSGTGASEVIVNPESDGNGWMKVMRA